MNSIDINTDIGEGFLFDEELLQKVSSCNIACGGHTGNAASMRATIQLAKKYKVTVGAHPSYPDPIYFGRKVISISTADLERSLISQIQALVIIGISENYSVQYVKPHGALYNQAMVDVEIAKVIVSAVKGIDQNLAMMGMPNSVLEDLCKDAQIKYIKESFADRRYHADGRLVSRSQYHAVIHQADQVWEQIAHLILQEEIISIENKKVALKTDSICFHGDTPEALELLTYVVDQLKSQFIAIKPILPCL